MVNLDESTDEIEDDSKQTWSEAFNPSDNDYEADYGETEQEQEQPNITYKGDRENAIVTFYSTKSKMKTLNFEDNGHLYMITAFETRLHTTIIEIYKGDIEGNNIIKNIKWVDNVLLIPQEQ